MGGIAGLNLGFILLFYKEMKLATSDAGLAAAPAFFPAVVHYVLMGLGSLTAIGGYRLVRALDASIGDRGGPRLCGGLPFRARSRPGRGRPTPVPPEVAFRATHARRPPHFARGDVGCRARKPQRSPGAAPAMGAGFCGIGCRARRGSGARQAPGCASRTDGRGPQVCRGRSFGHLSAPFGSSVPIGRTEEWSGDRKKLSLRARIIRMPAYFIW
jgi:hypothetical protein